MWALCRRDHGLTWTEFTELTLAQLEALEERRAIAIRHERFNAALIASAVVNVNLPQNADAVSPFDFLAGFEVSAEEQERVKMRKSIKQAIAVAFSQGNYKTREQALAARSAMVQRMKENGVEDPDGLIREVFPEM